MHVSFYFRTAYTLKLMAGVALVFVPIVISYKIWVYRLFRCRVSNEDVLDSH